MGSQQYNTPNFDTRPGYINGKPVLGYEEVTMHDIAAIANDIWGGHVSNTGRILPPPLQRRYRGPHGRWRKYRRKHIYGAIQWYIAYSTERGRKVITVDAPRRDEQNKVGYDDKQ